MWQPPLRMRNARECLSTPSTSATPVIRGGQASFSGQRYLAQIADGTGGRAYYEGTGNPVSYDAIFKQFKNALQRHISRALTRPGARTW